MTQKKLRIAILGASGYTGIELLRLLLQHPAADIVALTADKQAGKKIDDVYPHLRSNFAHGELVEPWGTTPILRQAQDEQRFVLKKIEEIDWENIDVVFCCLPHGTTQEVIADLPAHLTVFDLSADFRLRDPDQYLKWYGHAHQALNLQKEAIYGLPEIYAAQIKKARLIACPGCYPTSAILPLYPLLKENLIDSSSIIVDAKSGVSGAGRTLKESSLYTEVAEGIMAYGVANHRHAPEIEQELSAAGGKGIQVTFTPHLMPMNRGILSTIYVKSKMAADKIHEKLQSFYAAAPFVKILPLGQVPATRDVRFTNFCHIGVVADRVPGQIILVSVIDNLVKGASGQAVQCFNLRFGFAENTGLQQTPIFP
jgi:N-acetyl-gamma-glutamyl-phosphate reductase